MISALTPRALRAKQISKARRDLPTPVGPITKRTLGGLSEAIVSMVGGTEGAGISAREAVAASAECASVKEPSMHRRVPPAAEALRGIQLLSPARRVALKGTPVSCCGEGLSCTAPVPATLAALAKGTFIDPVADMKLAGGCADNGGNGSCDEKRRLELCNSKIRAKIDSLAFYARRRKCLGSSIPGEKPWATRDGHVGAYARVVSWHTASMVDSIAPLTQSRCTTKRGQHSQKKLQGTRKGDGKI
ncbi:hypothetical protein cyc_01845 [Cyclospora cayetanensis]|uniref:Uncharacterized protein n=1 Tax=Cyclospora cayetanensis TaxID=88456 RepID=A0A1D3CUJ3_9EIME|nr:hypothetical protein cyc_01845 [Cyclospora cayetanensis]